VTETGKLAWKAQLDGWGVPRAATEGVEARERTENPWRYPGQYEDAETGLYYNRFRYYDPEAGRYVSPDPIGLDGGLAIYGYVRDPFGWIDPLGLSCGPSKAKAGAYYEAEIDAAGKLRLLSGPLSLDAAASKMRGIVREGPSGHLKGVYTKLKGEARALAAKLGDAKPIRDGAHGTGGDFFPHFHPAGRPGGHVWYGAASP
jgi:RHS repeat-associated protein